jgi:AcrR family transcriptional regulator
MGENISRVIVVENKPRPRGRPRAFDRDVALAAAAETFWQHGYEGASIADLTAAMGITPQSLYAAFSSKAELHREAIGWYQAEVGAPTRHVFEDEPSAVVAIERLLEGRARQFCGQGRPTGCMISSAVLYCAAETQPIARHLSSLRTRALASLKARIERGIAEGELRPDTDASALARFVATVIQGLSVQARDGASEDELLAVARIAAAELARHRVDTPG